VSRQTPIHRLPEIERLRALQSAVNRFRGQVVDVKYHLGDGRRQTFRCALHCVSLAHLTTRAGSVILVVHTPGVLDFTHFSASAVVSIEAVADAV
jgi:hypothetical protein